MRIAVDAMGGDHAPHAPVRAVVEYVSRNPDAQIVLVGDRARIQTLEGVALPGAVEVVHAESVIESGEDPVRAVRRKQGSSLVTAARMVRDKEASAMISAGNTGALVAAGLLSIGRLQGIDRPALAPVLPTFSGKGVLLLDAGATMDASSKNLLQYAKMGDAYSRYVLGVDKPRIGLLNVGSEEGKGNQVVKETYELLQASQLEFIGNVEARELLDGSCDVAVCDGFVGNVALKLIEGVGLGIFSALKHTLMQGGLGTKLAAAVLKPSLRAFRDRFDYAEYGGAPFLGVAGGCIKAHGSSNERAWYTAIEQSVKFVQNELLNKISETLHTDAPNG